MGKGVKTKSGAPLQSESCLVFRSRVGERASSSLGLSLGLLWGVGTSEARGFRVALALPQDGGSAPGSAPG